jgi:hypothetical protein
MPRHVDDIVNPPSDPVVTFVVTSSTVSSKLPPSAYATNCPFSTHVVALVHIQICIHVSLVCTPNGASQTWPWLLKGQHSLDIVSVDLLARDGIDDGRFDAEEGK